MSADNEIAIVEFPDNTFRVAEIRGCPDNDDNYQWTWFITAYYQEFDKNVFQTEDEALHFAMNLEVETGFVEYGITTWKAPKKFEEYQKRPTSVNY